MTTVGRALPPLSPAREEFHRLSVGGNLVPVYAEVAADLDTPLSAFLRLRPGPYSFLLESVEGGEKWARYSFLGSDPHLVFTAKGSPGRVGPPGGPPRGPPSPARAGIRWRPCAACSPGSSRSRCRDCPVSRAARSTSCP